MDIDNPEPGVENIVHKSDQPSPKQAIDRKDVGSDVGSDVGTSLD